jgi:hypothetical protein
VLSLDGGHQVGPATSAKRGSLLNVVICTSVGGTYVPPNLISSKNDFSLHHAKDASLVLYSIAAFLKAGEIQRCYVNGLTILFRSQNRMGIHVPS